MSTLTTAVRVGSRLSVVRDGSHRWRQISLVMGGLLTTIALLFSWGFVQAASAGEQREAAREAVFAPETSTTDLTMVIRAEMWEERQFPVVWLSSSTPGAPVPPGLERLPEPGTFVVSPAVLRSGAARALGMKLSEAGTGAGGTIGDAGLRARSEWLVYAAPGLGHSLGSGGALFKVRSFGVPPEGAASYLETDPSMPSAGLATYAVIWLVVLPALAFLISCSVSLSEVRDRRARSLHAIGLTPAQTRLVGAVEATVLVAIGAIVAGVVWGILDGHLTTIPLAGIVVVDGALSTGTAVIAAFVLLVVLVASLLGAATIRVSERQAFKEPRRTTGWAVVPLAAGVVGMVAGKLLGRPGVPVLLACVLVMTVSLPLALPWLVAKLGAVVSLRRSSAAWLAGRRLVHSPRALARPAVAVAVLVFTLGSSTGLYVLMVAPHDELGPPVYSFDWRDPQPGDFEALADNLAAIGGSAARVVDKGHIQVAWFASCDDAARAVGRSACTDAGGEQTVLDRASSLYGVEAHIGKAPASVDSSYVASAIVVTGPDRTIQEVSRATNFLPAANLGRLGPEPLAPPLEAQWLGGGAIVAMSFLLLCALHSFGNRSLAIGEEDLRLVGIGVELRQVRAVQRSALLAPLLVAIPVAATGALLFTWASSDVDLAATATGQILAEAVVIGVIAILFALGVGLEQRRRLITSARPHS